MSAETEKLRRLLALAAGEGEEARTAAHQACKLIQKHGFFVGPIEDAWKQLHEKTGDIRSKIYEAEAETHRQRSVDLEERRRQTMEETRKNLEAFGVYQDDTGKIHAEKIPPRRRRH